MTKFNPELPTMPMRIGKNHTLEHTAPWVEEILTRYAYGTEVEIKIYQRRSLPRLKLYWAVLNLCVANSENKYGTSEDLHDALKIALGYHRRVRVIGSGKSSPLLRGLIATLKFWQDCLRSELRVGNVVSFAAAKLLKITDRALELAHQLATETGETILLPGSISFAKMDEGAFKIYFDQAMLELTKAGYPVHEYLNEADQQLERNKDIPTATQVGSRKRVCGLK